MLKKNVIATELSSLGSFNIFECLSRPHFAFIFSDALPKKGMRRYFRYIHYRPLMNRERKLQMLFVAKFAVLLYIIALGKKTRFHLVAAHFECLLGTVCLYAQDISVTIFSRGLHVVKIELINMRNSE